jgi:hypothetical protein
MENNMTAVEWLVNQVEDFIGLIPVDIIDKAKAMEREQIIEAHDAAYIAMNLAFRGFDRSVEYYENTYGAQNNGKPDQLP